ncbi:hypothetical protein [Nannocystis pusilla]|uniref:hypothetical protein n=1 Tax=Nannocystis pusilla TaxID=889268 RepID=UPI003B80F71B
MSSGQTTMLYDVGTDVDLGDPKPVGCKGKIDFLFVISRYGGMEYFQAQLLDAFPKFIDTIEAKFADFDYHIMVVDGGQEWGSPTATRTAPSSTARSARTAARSPPARTARTPSTWAIYAAASKTTRATTRLRYATTPGAPASCIPRAATRRTSCARSTGAFAT